MEVISKIIGFVAIAFLISLVLAIPTWFLWNECLVGAINGINQISLLQALGINILCTGLFKSNVTTK